MDVEDMIMISIDDRVLEPPDLFAAQRQTAR